MYRCLIFLLAVVMAAVSPGSSRTRSRPLASVNPIPNGNELLMEGQMGHVLRNAPYGALLFRSIPATPSIEHRLPDNYTIILEDALVDNFKCDDREYGYYADMENNCQIFHVCVPLHKLYPGNFTTDTTMTFSFICPMLTQFTQDALVCAYTSEAVPCEVSGDLYDMNKNFFKIEINDKGEEEYAQWG